jgi:epoxide hydrolase-like predicted phosphatase
VAKEKHTMTIRAIVFDIGGVLEITPSLGTDTTWEQQLNLEPGALSQRLHHVWRAGGIGTISLEEVHRSIGEIIGLSEEQVNAYMADIWKEYLGTPNVELADYFRNLRPHYQTAILSNSFVGAREKEQEHYQFEEICDFIIYSHEVGMSKPDPRIYALTCQRLGLPPAEVIFLDDREQAIEAARACGLHGILFTNNAQAITDIEACIQANG